VEINLEPLRGYGIALAGMEATVAATKGSLELGRVAEHAELTLAKTKLYIGEQFESLH